MVQTPALRQTVIVDDVLRTAVDAPPLRTLHRDGPTPRAGIRMLVEQARATAPRYTT